MATLKINGETVTVDVAEDTPLLWVLREQVGLTGAKYGCGIAQCGACTVHLNNQAVRSCVTPVSAAAGQSVTTIEEVGEDPVGAVVQAAWIEHDVPQCGYCQSGQVMSAVALLRSNPTPSDAEIESAMAGNICRCGTYLRIKAAIRSASDNLG